MTTNSNNGTDRLDLLTDQIALLTEQVAETNRAIATGFAELKEIFLQFINRLTLGKLLLD